MSGSLNNQTQSLRQFNYSGVVAPANQMDSQMAMQEHKNKMKVKAEQENTNLWQHPYVDVFKHFKVQPGSDWKGNKKQGEVSEYFVSNLTQQP